MIAGQAAELRIRRQAEADAKNQSPDQPARPTDYAIAEIAPGKAPTIRGVIPIRGSAPKPSE